MISISRRTCIVAMLGGMVSLSGIANAQMTTTIAANGLPNNTTTRAFCLSAVYKGLMSANPQDTPWVTATSLQQRFLTQYAAAKKDAPAFNENVHTIATSDSNALERFFAHHGFPGMNISVQGKAIGTVFEVNVAWPTPGEKTTVRSNATGEYAYYQAAQMSEDVTAYRVNGSNKPLFKLATKQADWGVYIMEADSLPQHAADLPAAASTLLQNVTELHFYTRLIFPVVDWQGNMDMSFLQGMQVPSFTIDQAIGKAKLRLDEKGGRASSAVALVTRGGPDQDVYRVQRPFYVFFRKKGTVFPAFVAIAGPDSWTKVVHH